MSTVTDFKPKLSISPSLEETLTEFEQWREQKTNPATPIPEHLWEKIFKLAEQYPTSALKNLFGISGKQYNAKLQVYEAQKNVSAQEALSQLKSAPKFSQEEMASPSKPLQSNELCQVKLEKEKSAPYKLAELPKIKTMIVEFQRSDGRIMKIHTTQDSIMTLMKTFFEEK